MKNYLHLLKHYNTPGCFSAFQSNRKDQNRLQTNIKHVTTNRFAVNEH